MGAYRSEPFDLLCHFAVVTTQAAKKIYFDLTVGVLVVILEMSTIYFPLHVPGDGTIGHIVQTFLLAQFWNITLCCPLWQLPRDYLICDLDQ